MAKKQQAIEAEQRKHLYELFREGNLIKNMDDLQVKPEPSIKAEEKAYAYDYQFDFKYLLGNYYKVYVNENYYKELNNNFLTKVSIYGYDEKDPIQRWYKYKEIDAGEIDKKDKKVKKRFDCDSSNKTNDLMDEIYDWLWRKGINWGLQDVDKLFGGDTMNSFANTFNAFTGQNSYKKSFRYYMVHNKEQDFTVLSDYARFTGYLGNFVLAPKRYSQYRGFSPKIKDYWDLSLYNLSKNKDNQDWLYNIGVSFERYINMFFLWDYVEVVGKIYHVIPLFSSHKSLLSQEDMVFPNNDFKEFTRNVNKFILKRGAFMAAMLQIADKNKTDYQKIVNYLATNEILGTMDNILDELQKLLSSSDDAAKGILKDCKVELKNIE